MSGKCNARRGGQNIPIAHHNEGHMAVWAGHSRGRFIAILRGITEPVADRTALLDRE